MYHYMRMAERNRRTGLHQGKVRLKKYFYMLRPVLACMWIDQGLGTPPIELGTLLDRLLPSGQLREVIDALVEKKKRGDELDLAPEIPIVSDFIRTWVETYTEATKETQFTKDWAPLDALFRETLIAVNGNQIE